MSYAAYVWIGLNVVTFLMQVKKDNTWNGIIAAVIANGITNGILYWGDFYKIQ